MSPADSRNSVRSWPTQNPRPAPVTTTARTSSSRASLNAAWSARCIAALKAFSTSGRFSVIVRTPPSRLVSTSATAGGSPPSTAKGGGRLRELAGAPLEEAPLDGVRRQLERAGVHASRLVAATHPPQEVG